MGAFWHLFLSTTINITMNKNEFEAIEKNKIVLPELFAKNFFEVNRNEWLDENIILGARYKIDLTYRLSDENIDQIKPFLNEAWLLIESENSSIIPEKLNFFIKDSLTSLIILNTSLEQIDKNLNDIDDNYFLHYESIPSKVVYHGWPNELHSNSRNYSMDGFVFLNSYEKINVIPEETILFYKLKDKIKGQLSKKYDIANYIYALGY